MSTNANSKQVETLEVRESEAFCDLLIASNTQEQFQTLLGHPKLQTHVDNSARIRLYLAREFVFGRQFQIAQKYLQSISPPILRTDAYWYWNTTALVAAHFAEPFEEAFKNAQAYCSGHDLGVLWLNQGWAFSGIGQKEAALNCFQVALEHLRFPSLAMALADSNIGQILLEHLDPAAEHYFLRMQKVTRYEVAANQHAAAFLGLGDWHRLHGRLIQAQAFYNRALKAANTFKVVHSQIDAHAKLGFVCVLENKLLQAAPYLEAAKNLIPEAGTYDWVYTIEAFLYLKLGNLETARLVLKSTQNLAVNGLNRAGVLRAELERRYGREKIALEILKTIDEKNVGARELVPQFPELFALAAQHDVNVEVILEKRRHFVVRALGEFAVSCDGRVLTLPKGCDEMLVYFLHYGARDQDEALESLYWEELKVLNTMTLDKARQHFNKLLQRLRDALQWHDVIRLENKKYVVNLEAAIWELNWKSASKKRLSLEFLTGLERQWVHDIRDNF